MPEVPSFSRLNCAPLRVPITFCSSAQRWRILRSFPPFGCCESRCYGYGRPDICSSPCFQSCLLICISRVIIHPENSYSFQSPRIAFGGPLSILSCKAKQKKKMIGKMFLIINLWERYFVSCFESCDLIVHFQFYFRAQAVDHSVYSPPCGLWRVEWPIPA